MKGRNAPESAEWLNVPREDPSLRVSSTFWKHQSFSLSLFLSWIFVKYIPIRRKIYIFFIGILTRNTYYLITQLEQFWYFYRISGLNKKVKKTKISFLYTYKILNLWCVSYIQCFSHKIRIRGFCFLLLCCFWIYRNGNTHIHTYRTCVRANLFLSMIHYELRHY